MTRQLTRSVECYGIVDACIIEVFQNRGLASPIDPKLKKPVFDDTISIANLSKCLNIFFKEDAKALTAVGEETPRPAYLIESFNGYLKNNASIIVKSSSDRSGKLPDRVYWGVVKSADTKKQSVEIDVLSQGKEDAFRPMTFAWRTLKNGFKANGTGYLLILKP